MSFLKEFGEKVRKYRAFHGWSQADLAEHAEIGSASTISNIENGITEASLLQVKNLARALGIPLIKLIGEDEDDIAKVSNEDDGFNTIDYPYELSLGLQTPIHSIDWIKLNKAEMHQLVNYARFLVFQRETLHEEILKRATQTLNQPEI